LSPDSVISRMGTGRFLVLCHSLQEESAI
jgi:hypothetical protein